MRKMGYLQPLLPFCKDVLVVVKRGCGVFGGRNLESLTSSNSFDGILRIVGVLSDFLKGCPKNINL